MSAFFWQEQRADVFKFSLQCYHLMNATIMKLISDYGNVPMMYATVEGNATYKDTDTLWADMGNAHYQWMCEHRGYLKDSGLGPEKKGDVLAICFGLYMLASCYGVNLMRLFKMDSTHMPHWYTQWAMMGRDLYLSSMAGLGRLFMLPSSKC